MRIAIATCQKNPNGNPDDIHLIEALKAGGHDVTNSVWNNEKIDWSQFDLCVLRSPWDYYKHLKKFLAWAERVSAQTRLVNPLATITENCRKDYLLELEKRGLPIVPTFIFSDRSLAAQKSRELLKQGPIVLKPTVSGGSYLTYCLQDETGLADALSNLENHGKILLQPFLRSVAEEGEVSLMYFRVKGHWAFSHAVLKRAAQGDFRVQADFGGKEELYEPSAPVLELAARILETLNPNDLYIRIDLVNWRTQPLIGELELIEPALFFSYSKEAAGLFAKALLSI